MQLNRSVLGPRSLLAAACALLVLLGTTCGGNGAERPSTLGPYKFAKLYPVERNNVSFAEGFWKARIDASRDHGLLTSLKDLEDRDRFYVVRNFLIDSGAVDEKRNPEWPRNPDEFLYKWLEAASYYSADEGTGEIRAELDRMIEIVLAAQKEDGYINTWVTSTGRKRFSEESWMEFYFGGHLMQAGIAHYRMTGERVLFDAAKKYIDLLRRETTPKENWPHLSTPSDRRFVQRHPNVEMALVELYRVTGDARYLEFARLIMEGGENYLKRTGLAEHAVKETLINTGAIDYYIETGDERFFDKVREMWEDLNRGKMYITGGVGARRQGEAYGDNYELPNETSYAETCAAISSVFWQWRMLLATGEAKYADLMERILFNGFLAGVSLDSNEYFYTNRHCRRVEKLEPADGGRNQQDNAVRYTYWLCACCPPNIHRLFASLQQYVYTAKDEDVGVHLYAGSTLKHTLPDGADLTLKQATDYPWGEGVELGVTLSKPAPFTLSVRIPGWCRGASAWVNGEAVEVNSEGGYYLKLDREWRDGDHVKLNLPMPPRIIEPHPKVEANRGRLAIMRGPLVYCLESADNPGIDLDGVRIAKDIELTPRFEPELLEGVATLTGQAVLREGPAAKTVRIKVIPYYAWANREPGKMDVWVRELD